MTVNNEQHKLSDLEWNAFRFISDEMTASERDQFEGQLCTNPAAAVAMSRVLELEHAIAEWPQVDEPIVVAAAPMVRTTQPTQQATTSSSRAALAVVVSIAACCLVAFLLSPTANRPAHERELMTNLERQPADIIGGWLEFESADGSLSEPIGSELDELGGALEIDPGDELALLDSEDIVPGWMYAAFQGTDGNGESFE